jgi:hypothetical protein
MSGRRWRCWRGKNWGTQRNNPGKTGWNKAGAGKKRGRPVGRPEWRDIHDLGGNQSSCCRRRSNGETKAWVSVALFAWSGRTPCTDDGWCHNHSYKSQSEEQVMHKIFTFQGKTRLQIDILSIGRKRLSFIRVRKNPQKVHREVS